MLEGVVIILRRDKRFLVGKRSSWKQTAPNMWTSIAGKIEKGESESSAVVREAWEEIGVRVKPLAKIEQAVTRDGSTRLHYWLGEITEGEPFLNNDENSELKWLNIEEIKQLENTFAEEIEILNRVLNRPDVP